MCGHETGAHEIYTASSTGLDVLFPSAELSIGRKDFASKLRDDEAFREKMKASLLRKMKRTGFGDFEYCQVCFAKRNTQINGSNLKRIAKTSYGSHGRREQQDAALTLFLDHRRVDRLHPLYPQVRAADVPAPVRLLVGRGGVAGAEPWSRQGLRPDGRLDHSRGPPSPLA